MIGYARKGRKSEVKSGGDRVREEVVGQLDKAEDLAEG